MAPQQQQPALEIVAHRGTGRDYPQPIALQAHRPAAPPENTLPAFEWGWARGGTCELDVYLTRDGKIVVIHDPTTGRTCDRDLVVGRASLDELRQLDAGVKKGPLWKGLRLPTLREVLQIMPPSGRLYIEAKNGPGIVEPLLGEVDAAAPRPDQIVYISFSIDTISALKRARPEITCYWILVFVQLKPGIWRAGYDRTEADNLTFRTVWQEPVDYAELIALARHDDLQLDGLDVSFEQPDDFAAAMRQAQMPWGSWAVDDGDVAVALARKGAIQLTSNHTDDIWGALSFPRIPSWPIPRTRRIG
ncbi:MAG TPA: glycerophosphodiester phosphodiesterase family protein [Thermoanaerobaculia bacterium]|nr:glycerophosphodiester phosphodiesterase family protein [Thermoanaerobaculia bacterium]